MPDLKKRQDGLYRAWYNGKQFYGRTKVEAKAKRDAYKYECEHGLDRPLPRLVSAYAEEWLPLAKAGVSPKLYRQYKSLMNRLTDAIGGKYLASVTPDDLKLVWKSYVGYSQSYINKASFLYKAFFQSAVDNGYCKSNPAQSRSAKPHHGTSGSHRSLTPTEIRLIETVPHRCQPAALFMLHAGLRRGEVLALTKDCIHDDRIFINNAVIFDSNRPLLSSPKTESSVRSVPLFAPLKPVYDALEDGAYILPDKNGGLCSETAFVRAWQSYLSDLSAALNGCPKRWWHLTADWKAQHPEEYRRYLALKENPATAAEAEAYRLRGWRDVSFRPHDLRHTFVTRARDRGIDLHVCMGWCGHSSEKMILQIYDHVTQDREQSAIDAINRP